jgi:hypothetical protein
MPGVGQAEDADNHQQQADTHKDFFYHQYDSSLSIMNFTNLHR